MPGIMSEDANFENHQNFERQLPRRVWRRHRVRLASDIDLILSLRAVGLRAGGHAQRLNFVSNFRSNKK